MYVVKAEFTDGDPSNNFFGNFGPFEKPFDAEIAVLNLSARGDCINAVVHRIGDYAPVAMTAEQEGSS